MLCFKNWLVIYKIFHLTPSGGPKAAIDPKNLLQKADYTYNFKFTLHLIKG
jgi:hypothetical protein